MFFLIYVNTGLIARSDTSVQWLTTKCVMSTAYVQTYRCFMNLQSGRWDEAVPQTASASDRTRASKPTETISNSKQ